MSLGVALGDGGGSRRYRPPSGLQKLPMALVAITAGGVALTDRNAAEAFQNSNIFTYNPTTIDVTDATTLSNAVRTSTAGSRVRLTANITTDPFDLRSTDASQAGGALGKLVDTNGFTLTMRTTGPSLPAQVYTVDATNTNCWKTTLALTGSADFFRLFRTDVLDGEGEPTPFMKYASAAALNVASGDGFFWDNVGKVLWVKLSTNGSVEAFKANLKGLYLGAAGTSRILVSGAPLCLWANGGSLVLDGVQIVQLDAASRLPMFYHHGMRQTYAVSKGFDGTNCGHYVGSSSLIYGSQADGANAFASSAVAKGLIQTANCRFVRNGDTRTFAADGTLQGISAHGSSDHVSFNPQCTLNNGQGIADTCAAGSADITLVVGGTITGGASTSANLEFGSVAASASRTAYLDSVTSTAAPANGDVAIGTNAVVKTFNTTLGNVTGGAVSPYAPGSV